MAEAITLSHGIGRYHGGVDILFTHCHRHVAHGIEGIAGQLRHLAPLAFIKVGEPWADLHSR